MNYSRLRIFACPRMLFILLFFILILQLSPLFAPPCWAQKGGSGAFAELCGQWKTDAQPARCGRAHVGKQQLREDSGSASGVFEILAAGRARAIRPAVDVLLQRE